METTTTPPGRRRVLQAGDGLSTDAFGAPEWGLLSAVAVIWGSSFLWMEIGLEHLRPGVVTLARVGLGAATLACVPRARISIDREDLPRFAVVGYLWMGIPLLLFPIAQQHISSSLAGMLNGGVPLTTALWSTLLLRRLPGRTQLIGLAIGFGGIVAISLPGIREDASTAFGTFLVLTAVFLYGLVTNLAVPLQQRYGGPAVALRAMLFALTMIVPVGLWQLPGSTFDAGAVLAMLPLGIFGTGLAFVAMTTLVGRVGAPRGSIAIYFVPIVAIALGVALRGDDIAPVAIAGTGLVLLGAWITSRREARRAAQ